MNTEEMFAIAQLVKKYALVKPLGIVAVLSDDVSGMTYVGRWVRSNSIEGVPEGTSWAEMSKLAAEKKDD